MAGNPWTSEAWADELIAKNLFPLLGEFGRQAGVKLALDPMADQFTIPLAALPKDAQEDPGAGKLCAACSGMTISALEGQKGYRHSSQMADLIASADKTGCPLCGMIKLSMLKAIRFHLRTPAEDDDILFKLQTPDEDHEEPADLEQAVASFGRAFGAAGTFLVAPVPVILKIDRSRSTNGGRYVAIGTEVWSASARAFGLALYWGRLMLHDGGSESVVPLRPRGSEDEILGRLSAWLRQRQAEMPERSRAAGDPPLPTRVLDLQAFDATQDAGKAIRLTETAGRRGRYLALSYCWGGYSEFRTLRDNYDNRTRHIALEALPAVFSQAVKITRGLGVRYLWIDALCIVQDDVDDWRREAACMAEIYWNTECRLAVTDSQNPTQGFFPPRELIASVRVPSLEGTDVGNLKEARDGAFSNSSSSPPTPYNAERVADSSHKSAESQMMYLSWPQAYSIDVDRGLLNKRGWVLQERLLAPRTMHFTKAHIYCEDQDDACGEDWVRRNFTWRSCVDTTSEYTPIELLPERNLTRDWWTSMDHDGEDGHAAAGLWLQRSAYRKAQRHMIQDPWLRIAENYSTLRFTYPSDRLTALAGLIKKKKNKTGRDRGANYLGLWSSDLHVELAWAASQGFSPTSPPRLRFLPDLRLPSWTWLAYGGGRIWFTKDSRFSRDPGPVRAPPSRDFALLVADNVPDVVGETAAAATTTLPLSGPPATLTMRTRIREIGGGGGDSGSRGGLGRVSDETTTYGTTAADDDGQRGRRPQTREELAASSPFHFDERTGTVPISLAAKSQCRDVLDGQGRRIGFVAFDEAAKEHGALFFAQLSTLWDEVREDEKLHSVPILTYALVLVKTEGIREKRPDGAGNVARKEGENDYKRVGLAEVNCEWMAEGDETVIRLF